MEDNSDKTWKEFLQKLKGKEELSIEEEWTVNFLDKTRAALGSYLARRSEMGYPILYPLPWPPELNDNEPKAMLLTLDDTVLFYRYRRPSFNHPKYTNNYRIYKLREKAGLVFCNKTPVSVGDRVICMDKTTPNLYLKEGVVIKVRSQSDVAVKFKSRKETFLCTAKELKIIGTKTDQE